MHILAVLYLFGAVRMPLYVVLGGGIQTRVRPPS
jgi:hypothetical protein